MPETSKKCQLQATFNSKKACTVSGTSKLQKGAFSGTGISQYVREILYEEVGCTFKYQIISDYDLAYIPSQQSFAQKFFLKINIEILNPKDVHHIS